MRADARAKRRDLIAAARRLYGARGSDVSLRAIAGEAGVGIATLYRHFPTPLDLLVGIAEAISEEVSAIAVRAAAEWDGDPAVTWHDFVHDLADLRLGAVVTRITGEHGIASLPPDIAEVRDAALAKVEAVLVLARRDGLIRPEISALRFHIGLAAVARPLPDAALEELPDQVTWLTDIFLRGVRPAPESDG